MQDMHDVNCKAVKEPVKCVQASHSCESPAIKLKNVEY